MAACVLGDLMQQERLGTIIEIVVKQKLVGGLEDAVVLVAHNCAVHRVGLRAVAQELQDRAGLSDLLLHAGETAG